MNARHLTLPVLAALVSIGAVACGSAEEAATKKTAEWSCSFGDVPMGERLRCTQSALNEFEEPTAPTATPYAEPVITSPSSMFEWCEGSLDNPELCTTYECTAGSADCPPAGGGGGVGGTDTTTPTTPPATSGSTSDSTTTTSGGGASAGNGNGNGGAGGNGHGPNSNASTFGSHGSSATPGPDECAWVSLPYCGGAGSDASGSTGTESTAPGNSGSGGNKGAAPGQEKKASGAPPSSSGSTGTSGSGGGQHYKCVKDKKGNKSCEAVAECATGTHPSSCGACVPDGESGDCVPPSAGGCWVTGGGFIVGPNVTTGAGADGHDNFGGNAKPMKDGRIQGHWNHVDHGTGNHSKGKPEYIVCRHVDEPGPGQPGGKKGFTMNQVYFGGHAEWRSNGTWAGGYWFDVVAKDHGEPGSVPHVKNGFMPDTYHFTIRLISDPTAQTSGAIVYETKGVLQGGNIQMHPPNAGHPYTPSNLPGWVAVEP